jgi:hypothetical protein
MHLFIRKLKKKTILHELSIPNPNLSDFAFFGEYIRTSRIVISIFQAINELVCFKNPNLLF